MFLAEVRTMTSFRILDSRKSKTSSCQFPLGTGGGPSRTVERSRNRFNSGQQFIGFGAHANIFREIRPAHGSCLVHQKFGGPGNIMTSGTAADVQQVIAANRFRVGIGEKREGIPGFAAEIFRLLRTIDADGYRTDSRILELCQVLLYAS